MTQVTFSMPWINPDTGDAYKGGDIATIHPATARNLIDRGRARHTTDIDIQAAALAAEREATELKAAELAAVEAGESTSELVAPAVAAEPEPTAEVEPTGAAKIAPAKSRSKTKEATPDEH